jgi:hypothetical protein
MNFLQYIVSYDGKIKFSWLELYVGEWTVDGSQSSAQGAL